MNTDPTKNIRREDQARINAEAAERAELVEQYGMVWSTNELREAFEVLGFIPLVTLSWPMNSLFFSRRTGRAKCVTKFSSKGFNFVQVNTLLPTYMTTISCILDVSSTPALPVEKFSNQL